MDKEVLDIKLAEIRQKRDELAAKFNAEIKQFEAEHKCQLIIDTRSGGIKLATAVDLDVFGS